MAEARVDPVAVAQPRERRGLGRFMALGAVASMTGLVASLVRNKALALAVGPEGIGIIGEALQLALLGMTLSALAGGPVLGGMVATAAREMSNQGARRALGTSLILGLALGAAGGIGVVLLAPTLLPAVWPVSTRLAVVIAVASSLLAIVPTLLSTSMAALEDTTGTVVAALVSSLIGAAGTAWLALRYGLIGALLSLVASSAVTATVTCLCAWRTRRGRDYLWPELKWDPRFARTCMTLGAAGLVGAFVQQVSLVSMRAALERAGGASGAMLNGQFQAAFGLEGQFFAFSMTGLFTYVWPQFATTKSAEETTVLLERVTSFILRTFPPLVIAGMLVRREVMTVLFSDRFLLATDVLGWFLAAVTAKALIYAYGAPLYFAGTPFRFAALGVTGFGLVGICSVAAIHRFGVVGAGIGQVVGVVLHLGLAMAFTRATMPIKLRAYRAVLAVALAAAVLVMDRVLVGASILRWILFAVTLVWIGVNLRTRSPKAALGKELPTRRDGR